MKKIINYIMFVMFMITSPLLANDIYVTQSGASLTLDILQDGENNTIGNSTTASTSTGATTSLNIDQVGDSNVITYQINGATYTGVVNFTGNSNDIDLDIGETSDASNADVDIVGNTGSDSNVVAATVDGTSAILTITINGDTNNYLIDIDGNGDVNGHTLVHTHTGGIADVDITQSGVNDNMITLTTSGDNANIDIIQRD